MDTLLKLTIICVTILLSVCWTHGYDPSTCIKCRTSHVCKAPDCFCCRDEMPLGSHNIPQMVFFTFDDAVNPAVAKHYRDLFDTSRLNPNGCPIRMTLFVSHRSTVYKYVREFYEKGMEIASHSVTHSHPNSQTFLREAKKQKENLAKKANIPENKIVGWRSPFLEPLGDTQPKVLKDLGYEYDATLTITKKGSNDKAITPFTLDFGWPYDCKIKPCPANSHNGFWEVPVVSVKDYKNKYNCVYVDACHSPPPSENMAYKFLWDNFQRYYSTNRAPMGINMHASWFYYPDRKAAMDKFIQQLVKMDDVYIVTVKQVIDWLKDPTPLNKIKTFQPWQCNGNVSEPIGTRDTNPGLSQNIPRPTGRLSMQTQVPKRVMNWPQQNNKQIIRPTVGSVQGTQRPKWSERSNSPIPVIPYAPTARAVRFWWRPPKVVITQSQIDAHLKQTVAPQTQSNIQQQKQQARLARERQDVLRKERIEKQRQMELANKAHEEKVKREQAEKQKQEELRRQALLRKQQVEQKMAEEKRRHEQLRQEEIARQEEQRRVEFQKQRELEQQKLEEQKRQELAKQHQLEKQKYEEQLALQKQKEHSLRKQQLHQGTIEKNEIAKEQQQNQNKNNSNLIIEENTTSLISGPDVAHGNLEQVMFSRKLDEMLTHSQNARIEMLQQLSLHDLQLLQSEVLRRMKKIPAKEKTTISIITQQAISDQPGQGFTDKNFTLSELSNVTELPPITPTELSKSMFSNEHKNIPPNPLQNALLGNQIVTGYPQQTIVTEPPVFTDTRYTATELPGPIHIQEIVEAKYDTTTITAMSEIYQKVTETLADITAKEPNIPFFSARPQEFQQQPVVTTPADKVNIKPKEPTWSLNKFDFQSLDGPWKRTPTTPKQTTVTVKPTKKTSLRLSPVSIRLFSTNNRYEAMPLLSKTAFVRPNLFSHETIQPKLNPNPANSYTYAPIQTDDIAITRERLEGLNLSHRADTSSIPTPKPSITTKATTTTSSPTTTPSATTTTSSTTTTTIPTTTTSATTTTTASTTTPSTTTVSTTTPSTTTTTETIIQFTPEATNRPQPTRSFNIQDRPLRTFVPIPSNWHLAGPMFRPSKPPTFKTSSKTTKESGCVQAENCILPTCVCKSEDLPKNMFQKEVPQIVYITIDGSLNFHSLSKIRKMFTGRVNPNGCPVKGTMFITDAGSSYRIANLLVNSGIELSMMGMNSRPSSNIDDLKSGLILQRLRISESANIPRDSIRGWRSPGFKTLGDKQYELLSKLNMYDSSLVVDRSPKTKPKLWPFTLDYGFGEKCEIVPCPVRRHPGVWEVPVMPLMGPDNSTTCEYVDGCTTQPKTTEQTFNFLMDNFNQYYSTNRAPFAIRLKQIWFHWYYRDNLKGLFKFLDTILGYGDVYVTSISDMLEWVKNPKKLKDMDTFNSWKCT